MIVFFDFLEILFSILFVVFFTTQVIVPLILGKSILPMLDKRLNKWQKKDQDQSETSPDPQETEEKKVS